MWNRSVWLMWLLTLPLALFTGYLLATPDDSFSFGTIGLILLALSIPLLLKWHYPLLIFSWNAALVPFFIRGRPEFWTLMVFVSLLISLLHRSIKKDETPLKLSSIAYPLLFLGMVVVVTAKLSGGIGVAALGSQEYGGRKYFYTFTAIIGFFALTAQSIPQNRVRFFTTLFFLSGLTAIVGNLAYMGGPGLYFLFALFPADAAISQAAASESLGNAIVRIVGLSTACLAVFCVLLAHNGIRDLLNLRRPWKLALLIVASFASLLGGFRSSVIMLSLIFVLLFYFEGLHRTRLLPGFVIGIILVSVLVVPFISKMPYSVQRALSILPVQVDPVARADARQSSEWRIEMWKILIPQIPQYLFKGKGYAIDPTDLYMAEQASRLGLADSNERAMVAGDYHNGPLSILIPFGILGLLGFIWFLAACLRALFLNFRNGDPHFKRINAFLLAYFLARTIYFFVVYGAFSADLYVFVGIIGFSISINKGIKRQAPSRMEERLPEPFPIAA